MDYPGYVAHGLMFHHLHDGRHPKGQGSISQEDFEHVLRFVGVRRILDPHAWLERLEGGRLSDGDICITFDDSLLCQFEVALPVLEKYGLSAFWFVYSGVFEGQEVKFEVYRAFRSRSFPRIDDFYDVFFRKVFASESAGRARAILDGPEIARMTRLFPILSPSDMRFRLIRDQVLSGPEYERVMDELMLEHDVSVAELAKNLWMCDDHLRYLTGRGHVVGLHSYSHPMVLGALPYEDQVDEYERNAAHIKRACGTDAIAMAHPANSYTDDTLAILSRLGIRCGFRSTMVPRREGDPRNANRLDLAREDSANIMRMMGR